MTSENNITGTAIAKYRQRRGMQASEVAEKLGVSEVAYRKYESGEIDINSDDLTKVAEALDIDPLELASSILHTIAESMTTVITDIERNIPLSIRSEGKEKGMKKIRDGIVALNERLMPVLKKNNSKEYHK